MILNKLLKALELFNPPPNLWRPEMENNVKINEKNARHAYEFLQLINDAETEDKKIELLKKWGNQLPLNMLLSLNFNDKVKLDLPEGMPPYKRDESVNADLMTPLSGQIHRLKACKEGSGIKKVDRERVFIQVLEQISHKEADVLCACKDKQLNELYPNITSDLVSKVFPNYVVKL